MSQGNEILEAIELAIAMEKNFSRAAKLADKAAVAIITGKLKPKAGGYLNAKVLDFVLDHVSEDYRRVLGSEFNLAMERGDWKGYCRLEFEALSSALSLIIIKRRIYHG